MFAVLSRGQDGRGFLGFALPGREGVVSESECDCCRSWNSWEQLLRQKPLFCFCFQVFGVHFVQLFV